MNSIFLFCSTAEEQQAWENMPEDALKEAYGEAAQWFVDNGSKIRGGYELQSPATATTVRFSNGSGNGREPEVTDGPYIEGNEVIGGFAEIEVDNLDEALRMAKSWPGGAVEIRPVVER